MGCHVYHLVIGPARFVLPLAGPRRFRKELLLFSAHTHLTSREAGSEIWIYEDLWNVGKEGCSFSEDLRGCSAGQGPIVEQRLQRKPLEGLNFLHSRGTQRAR